MSMYQENNAYRRGVILGLTLAEIMLLILFLLLLTFASVLTREKTKYEQEIKRLSKKNNKVDRIINVLEQNDPSISDELVEAFESLPNVVSLVKKEKLKKNDQEKTNQVLVRAIDKLVLEKSLDSNKDGVSEEDNLKKALAENQMLKSQVANLEGQNKNIINQLNNQGKGADYPPCWADPSGHAEYIYDVYLGNNGITIKDNQLANRIEDQAKLPINRIIYNEPLSQHKFLSQTSSLRQWSVDHQCRFYVRIFDETDGNRKSWYKQLLRTVENSFYKKLMWIHHVR